MFTRRKVVKEGPSRPSERWHLMHEEYAPMFNPSFREQIEFWYNTTATRHQRIAFREICAEIYAYQPRTVPLLSSMRGETSNTAAEQSEGSELSMAKTNPAPASLTFPSLCTAARDAVSENRRFQKTAGSTSLTSLGSGQLSQSGPAHLAPVSRRLGSRATRNDMIEQNSEEMALYEVKLLIRNYGETLSIAGKEKAASWLYHVARENPVLKNKFRDVFTGAQVVFFDESQMKADYVPLLRPPLPGARLALEDEPNSLSRLSKTLRSCPGADQTDGVTPPPPAAPLASMALPHSRRRADIDPNLSSAMLTRLNRNHRAQRSLLFQSTRSDTSGEGEKSISAWKQKKDEERQECLEGKIADSVFYTHEYCDVDRTYFRNSMDWCSLKQREVAQEQQAKKAQKLGTQTSGGEVQSTARFTKPKNQFDGFSPLALLGLQHMTEAEALEHLRRSRASLGNGDQYFKMADGCTVYTASSGNRRYNPSNASSVPGGVITKLVDDAHAWR